MKTKRSAVDWFLTGLLAVASVLYVYPIFMILINSLKQERAIGTATVFELPTGDTFAGLENFVNAVASKGFMESLFYSTFITITSSLSMSPAILMAWAIAWDDSIAGMIPSILDKYSNASTASSSVALTYSALPISCR